MFRLRALTGILTFIAASVGTADGAVEAPTTGHPVPAFTYRLLNGSRLAPKALKGHPYVLWMVASWCSSCQTGSTVVGDHIAALRSRGVRVVEMRLANDLGAPGPGLREFQKAVGANATSSNWYWGELTQAQSAVLDPKGYPDLYYLVNANGRRYLG